MIVYNLRCRNSHEFEGWFRNSEDFDSQRVNGLIFCPVCDTRKVEKAIMAPRLLPRVATGEPLPEPPAPAAAQAPTPAPVQPEPAKSPVAMMSPPERELREKLKELRAHITKNANYVGNRFPEEARKIHYGETEHRSIYGEASPEEAKALHEEGIEFHPIPVLPEDQN